MSYVKCVACPSREMCDSEGQCLNTWVTAQQCGATLRSTLPPGTYVATITEVKSVQSGVEIAMNVGGTVVKDRIKMPSDMLVMQRPAQGTTTGRVWDMADEYAAQQIDYRSKGFRRDVIARCEAAGINKSTASVQFGKWISSKS